MKKRLSRWARCAVGVISPLALVLLIPKAAAAEEKEYKINCGGGDGNSYTFSVGARDTAIIHIEPDYAARVIVIAEPIYFDNMGNGKLWFYSESRMTVTPFYYSPFRNRAGYWTNPSPYLIGRAVVENDSWLAHNFTIATKCK